jgi:hypothetical protein
MADKEMLLVQSKVREVIKEKAADIRISDEFLVGLNDHLYALLEKAIHRCKENQRATLRPHDV